VVTSSVFLVFFWIVTDVRSVVKRSGLAAQRINWPAAPVSPGDVKLPNLEQNMPVSNATGVVTSRFGGLESSAQDSQPSLTSQNVPKQDLSSLGGRGVEKLTAVKREAERKGVDLLEQFDKSISPITQETASFTIGSASDIKSTKDAIGSTDLVKMEFLTVSTCAKSDKPDLFLLCQIQLHSTAREVSVPATRVGRLMSYGGLVAGIGMGALNEGFKRVIGVSEGQLAFRFFFVFFLFTFTPIPFLPLVVLSHLKPVCERR